MRFKALDGCRGLSALFVALFHFEISDHLSGSSFIRNSYLFVDFFFVLSGFVIASGYRDDIAGVRSGGRFMLRRFARLYPLHLFVLALFVAVELGKLALSYRSGPMAVPPFSDKNTLGALISNLLMTQALGVEPESSWNYSAWSISVEFYTYLAFAALLLATHRLGRQMRILTLALCAVASMVIVTSISTAGMEVDFRFSLFRCFWGFFLGALGFELYVSVLKSWLQRLALLSGSGLELAAVAILVTFICRTGYDAGAFAAPFLFAAVTLIFAGETGILSRLLMSRPLQVAGDLSYSVYMIHVFIVLNLFGRAFSFVDTRFGTAFYPLTDQPGHPTIRTFDLGNAYLGDLLSLAYLAVVVTAAALSYRFIEVPARSAINALAQSLFGDGPRDLRPGRSAA